MGGGEMDGWMDGWWLDRWIDGWIYEWTDGHMKMAEFYS